MRGVELLNTALAKELDVFADLDTLGAGERLPVAQRISHVLIPGKRPHSVRLDEVEGELLPEPGVCGIRILVGLMRQRVVDVNRIHAASIADPRRKNRDGVQTLTTTTPVMPSSAAKSLSWVMTGKPCSSASVTTEIADSWGRSSTASGLPDSEAIKTLVSSKPGRPSNVSKVVGRLAS